MRKSYFLCGTSALSMLSAMPCMADETIRTSKETDERPNIVLIMADDMSKLFMSLSFTMKTSLLS